MQSVLFVCATCGSEQCITVNRDNTVPNPKVA